MNYFVKPKEHYINLNMKYYISSHQLNQQELKRITRRLKKIYHNSLEKEYIEPYKKIIDNGSNIITFTFVSFKMPLYKHTHILL